MSTSKTTLSARLQRRTLSLSEKIKLIDYKKSNPTISCRDVAEIFNIGKTSAATIKNMKTSFAKTMLVLKVTGSEFVGENFTNCMKQCICSIENAVKAICILLVLSYKKSHC